MSVLESNTSLISSIEEEVKSLGPHIFSEEEIAWIANINTRSLDKNYLGYLEKQARLAVESQTNFALTKKKITGRHINTSIPITFKPFRNDLPINVALYECKKAKDSNAMNLDKTEVNFTLQFMQTVANAYIAIDINNLKDETKRLLGISNTNIINNQRKYFKETHYYFEFSYYVGPDDPQKILTVHKNLLTKYIKFFATSSDWKEKEKTSLRTPSNPIHFIGKI